MNWNFALQMAKTEADKYALRGGKHPEGTEVYSIRFNAFLEGYMQNAGERESLRAILKKNTTTQNMQEDHEAIHGGPDDDCVFKVSQPTADKAPSLDELV